MWEYYVIMRSSAGGLDTRALGRQSAKHANRGVQNLAIREQRSVVVSEPFACCMSKANRIAKAVVAVAIVRLEGRRIGIAYWERFTPIKRVNGARTKQTT